MKTGTIVLGGIALLLVISCAPAGTTMPAAPSSEGLAALDRVRPSGMFGVGIAEAAGMWVFYPATAVSGPATEPLLPPDYAAPLTRRFGPLAGATLAAARGQAHLCAQAADGRFPLVLFAPGANMPAREYRRLIEEIASRGYVVAALNPLGSPPVSAARYGEIADAFAAGAAALLGDSRWASRIDGQRIALIGHSIGGGGAVLGLQRLPAARAAIDLDGDFMGAALSPAPNRAILYLTGRTDGESDASVARRGADWGLVRGANPHALRLEIAGMRHFDFSDVTLLPTATIPPDRRSNRFGPVGGQRAHALVVALVTGFLDQELKGEAGAFDRARAAVPEAIAGTA